MGHKKDTNLSKYRAQEEEMQILILYYPE